MTSAQPSGCLEHDTVVALIGGQLLLNQHPGIEAHLAECSICQSIVAAAAAALEDDDSGLENEGGAFPRPGDTLAGKFQLEGVIGRGGMGTVFAASHRELGRSVAIKVLHCTAPTAAARFLREAKISAQLVNEHTARVFDLGSAPNGAPFLVMECLEGEDLSQVIARGPVSPTLAVEYGLQICVALSEAHAARVVHRDLKPSNVFVTHRSDGSPCLKVLDFGISKRLIPGEGERSHDLTESHSVLGSPAYMSPEQLRQSKDVDARSDIWSLGVLLYELLTARRPFEAPSLSALSAAIAADAPSPPSSVNASVPAALNGIVMHCLRKDAKDRFASAAELADALRAATHPPVRTSRRRKGLIPVGGLVIAIAIFHFFAPEPSEATNVVPVLPRAPHVDPAQARVSIRCDAPYPMASVRLHSQGLLTRPELERDWPVDELCRASEDATARLPLELTRALMGSLPLSHTTLTPPHPCYVMDLQSSETEVALRLRQTETCAVQLTLVGLGCERIKKIEVTADGVPKVSLAVGSSDRSTGAPSSTCSHRVQLPSKAYGKSLRFGFRPSEYSSPGVAFASDALVLSVERRLLARPRKMKRPEPCVPPEYCRN